MPKCFIGLAISSHDPALAIVDEQGQVLFAEARERSLQSKRAFHTPPDDLLEIDRLLQEYAPHHDLVVATSWSAASLKWGTRLQILGEWLDRCWPNADLAATRALLYRMPASLAQSALALELRQAERGGRPPLRLSFDHHLCHAAAACYASPFEEAVCAVLDGAGERSATACYRYQGGQLTRLDRPPWLYNAASLGHFYGDLCWACGFDTWKGEEWKVMGLAAYGQRDAQIYEWLRPILSVRGLSLSYRPQLRKRLRALRSQKSALEYRDLAATGQLIFEEVQQEWLTQIYRHSASPNLVLSGGCALNSSANGKIVERTPFAQLYVPSAPADDGTALGAAWLAQGGPGHLSLPLSPALGSQLSRQDLARLDLPRQPAQAGKVAQLLAEGKLLGWFVGRAEWGPRALGQRSILADPRHPEVQQRLNDQVKFREAFRPFAPAILHEHGEAYFLNYQDSPYMERTLAFRPEMRSRVPGVVHVDGTGRVQSVTAQRNPRFHELLCEFYGLTGVPILLNTSLNVMGKPIVHRLEDALGVLFTSGLDGLVVEDCLILKGRSNN